MSAHSTFARVVSCSILGSLMVAPAASAAALPCVDRAINWMKANIGSGVNTVQITMVALHTTGIAAYATGQLDLDKCSLKPIGIGWADCLKRDSSPTVETLLNNRVVKSGGSSQPFDVHNPIHGGLAIRAIPLDSQLEVHMSQPGEEYRFHPECAGELVTGTDQRGNHWTMSFQLGSRPR